MYYCCGITTKGVMPHNEDALLINKTVINDGTIETTLSAPFMAAVSDGVSSELSGEIASKLCMKFLCNLKVSHKMNLQNSIMKIHERLKKYGATKNNASNMQATLCAFAIDDKNKIHTVNVGDSRLYRYKNSSLDQLSKDQSLVQMLFEEGAITAEERKTHVHKNIIFPVMGNKDSKPKVDIKYLDMEIEHGDLFILCTDGLTDYLSNSEIEEMLSLPLNLNKRLSKLVHTALAKGSTDNITIVAVCNMSK
ncbi:MAG: serine/threonine-protein phosphatase [Clostridiales bacterium]|nr:serine/threonine-protein phosphatase [Clostridiales bacterium]